MALVHAHLPVTFKSPVGDQDSPFNTNVMEAAANLYHSGLTVRRKSHRQSMRSLCSYKAHMTGQYLEGFAGGHTGAGPGLLCYSI